MAIVEERKISADQLKLKSNMETEQKREEHEILKAVREEEHILNMKIKHEQHDLKMSIMAEKLNLLNVLKIEGSSHPIPSSSEITFLELFSRKKTQNKAEWLVPPSHHWYKGRKPGLSLSFPCDRQSSTCLSQLASGHLNCLTYSEGNKIYTPCPKCQQHQASPQHILDCLGRN
ncbi:hypothetical protein AVEN_119218-1 [Araneus ventricosus]|uniref:Uncharacterized protein n=1 Tax=Araneus ventricosus TaxID=182803 RepID=A0A4Y2NXK1_ARAVE|nr:hypothetical protein AVEN_119218-1 [Araneus ventricosus]